MRVANLGPAPPRPNTFLHTTTWATPNLDEFKLIMLNAQRNFQKCKARQAFLHTVVTQAHEQLCALTETANIAQDSSAELAISLGERICEGRARHRMPDVDPGYCGAAEATAHAAFLTAAQTMFRLQRVSDVLAQAKAELLKATQDTKDAEQDLVASQNQLQGDHCQFWWLRACCRCFWKVS